MKSLLPDHDEQFDIGSEQKKWHTIRCKYLICGNISPAGVGISGLSEVKQGITLDSADNKIIIEDGMKGNYTHDNDLTVIGIIKANGTIVLGSNLKVASYKITRTGSKGITLDTSDNVTIGTDLTVIGATILNSDLDMNGHIALGPKNIGYSGGAAQGLSFNASEDATFSNDVIGLGYLRADKHLRLKDGITAPSTITGYALIYVDIADGDLKVKFGDGTVKTIVTDT